MAKPGAGRFAIVIAVAVFVFLVWTTFWGEDEPTPEPVTQEPGSAAPAPTPAPQATRAPVKQQGRAARPELDKFVVFSARTNQPLAGASVRVAATGKLLATTDEAGSATIEGQELSQLVFCADGHLIGFYAMDQDQLVDMRRQAIQQGHYAIYLEADRYTFPFSFRFMSSQGGRPGAVKFRLRCEPEDLIADGSPKIHPKHIALWRTHVLLNQLPGFEELTNHFGVDSSQRQFVSGPDAAVRFLMPGTYTLDVLSTESEVANQRVQVTVGQRAPLTVFLERGKLLRGQVMSSDGGPVRGAVVIVRKDLLGVRSTRTDAFGEFEVGPLPDEAVALAIQHDEYEDLETQPRRVGDTRWDLVLRPRPSWAVEGVVRSRPGNQPVAGATVSVARAAGPPAVVTTGPDGRFSGRSTAPETEVSITAEGFMEYAEIVTQSSSADSFDLIPATTAGRVQEKMTAMVVGRVLRPGGEVRPGTAVRLVPEVPKPFGLKPGRRIIRGGVLSLPHLAVADSDGRFEIECMIGGRARLVPLDGVSRTEDGLSVDVTLGTVSRELTLHARR